MGQSRKLRLKSDAYDKNITKRGSIPSLAKKKEVDSRPSVSPITLGIMVFVVIGSVIFEIIRNSHQGPIF